MAPVDLRGEPAPVCDHELTAVSTLVPAASEHPMPHPVSITVVCSCGTIVATRIPTVTVSDLIRYAVDHRAGR